jgi:RNA polymerase sigma-70 factor, ECF subfamily
VDAESDKHHDETALRAGKVIPAGTAFLECFETLKRVVAGLGIGAADAQDILQDVYLQASQRGAFVPAGQARAWLVRVTVNRALLEHRQRKRFQQLTTRIARERNDRQAASPDSLAARAEEVAAVRQAMQDLDEKLLVVMALRYSSGMDSTEIGEALGIPAATVRRRLHDARLILAKQLVERGFGP